MRSTEEWHGSGVECFFFLFLPAFFSVFLFRCLLQESQRTRGTTDKRRLLCPALHHLDIDLSTSNFARGHNSFHNCHSPDFFRYIILLNFIRSIPNLAIISRSLIICRYYEAIRIQWSKSPGSKGPGSSTPAGAVRTLGWDNACHQQ